MARSLKKGPYIHPSITKRLARMKPGSSTAIKTWARDSHVTPEMIGYTFSVHNGKAFTTVRVNEDMVGHRLGEFAPTRKFIRHGGRMQRELEQKAVQAGADKAKAEKTQTQK